MEGGRSRRPLAIGVAVLAVAAGVVLAILLTGGDDGDEKAATTPTTATETVTTETATERTETATTETTQAPQQDEQEIEQTVTTFVESAEQSDPAACNQVEGGAGRQLEDCAAAAGIDLRALPSSDELQIDHVNVSGDRAQAKLSNGGRFSLKKRGGRWKVSGFHRGRQGGLGSGGQRAPGP